MSDHIVIGICGGTGSGKTTLAKKLHESFAESSILVSMDSYYKDRSDLTYDERCLINYDHPEAFDTSLFVEQVAALKRGETVEIPTYDFTVHNRSEITEVIESAKIILLEGILLFENKALTDLMDMKIFVDTDADVRIIRRIVRDVKKRGRSLDSVVKQYIETVKPMHEMYVEPFKKCADIIVPEGGKNEVALDVIKSMLSTKLSSLIEA